MTSSLPSRLTIIDAARGVALIAMALYHFGWDLDFFGFTALGVAETGWGRGTAITIAGSFLTLVGLSLVLGHGSGIRWRPFLIRLAMVAAAALGVTLATSIATPDGMVVFGILHCIAVSSLLGLLFVRLPWFVTALVAIICLAAPFFLKTPALNGSAWVWLGLGSVPPRTNDYEPLLPWLGFVLAGIALARAVPPAHWPQPGLANVPGRGLRFLGRHSLAFYLLHQPILFGACWLAAQVFTPSPDNEATAFRSQCVSACRVKSNGAEDCNSYCTCVSEALQIQGLWTPVMRNTLTFDQRLKVDQVVKVCSR